MRGELTNTNRKKFRFVKTAKKIYSTFFIQLLGGGAEKLYFPRNYPASQIQGYYVSLITEQDSRSPHLYFKNGTDFISGKTFVDVGAAEAMSSLDVVKKAKRVVMFECEPNWIEALNATFEPWKEKVTIVPKFAGDVDDEKTVRLDSFFADVPADEKIALKLDVEGMEKKVLDGAQKILQKNATDLFVCTYHKHGDFEELGALIAKYGFSQSVSDGFMFFEHEFRHGIIRAVK